jgi:hypothetical protein
MTTKNGKKKVSNPFFSRRVNRKPEKIFLSKRRMERHIARVQARDKASAPAF